MFNFNMHENQLGVAKTQIPAYHPRDADSGSLHWDLRFSIDNKLPADASVFGHILINKPLGISYSGDVDHSETEHYHILILSA
jgi:hypothetical protein